MALQTKETSLSLSTLKLRKINPLKCSRHLLKTISISLLASLAFIENIYASQWEDREFEDYSEYGNFYHEAQSRITSEEPTDDQLCQQAADVIDGVIFMYSKDVNWRGTKIRYKVELGPVIAQVNASYTHGTRTFTLPDVQQNNLVIHTAEDQGIVAHEAGHMILNYLRTFKPTSHTGAFHEAFGDLTSHFYRFYNLQTRQTFLNSLEYGQGCVGDTSFTCTRNNSRLLRLDHVAQDTKLCAVHDLSKPFSSAVYMSMVNAYANKDIGFYDEYAAEEIVTWHRRMLVKAVLSVEKYSSPTLMDFARLMLSVSYFQPEYRDTLGQNFIRNGLVVLIYKTPTAYYDYEPQIFYAPNKKFAKLCLS